MSPLELRAGKDAIAAECQQKALQYFQSLGVVEAATQSSTELPHVGDRVLDLGIANHRFLVPEVHDQEQVARRAEFDLSHHIGQATVELAA